MKDDRVLMSSAIIVKEDNGKELWFLVNHEENGWEFPKSVVRKVESSVKTALRIMAEKGYMTTKVLEEAGRAGGVTTVNGKTLPQRHIYYIMVHKASSGEPIGFGESDWFEYTKAVRKISKREQQMLKAGREIYRGWKEKRARRRKEKK